MSSRRLIKRLLTAGVVKRARVQAADALGEKLENHKQGVVAKQAENDAQRAKIRAWKNGTFGKMSQRIMADTPPASQ